MARRRPQDSRDEADAIDPGNVIPFVRQRDAAPPLAGVGAAGRPAPDFLAARWSPWRIAVLATSLLAHAGFAALFLKSPAPAPALGVDAISVEVVLGADAPAGIAATPNDQEAQQQSPPASEQPIAKQEPVEPEPAVPAEQPIAKQETVEPESALETAPAIPPPDPEAVAKQEPKQEKKKEEAPPPSQAASGVGRGRSHRDANYEGLVLAHLARYQRLLKEAGNKRGTANVGFSLDGSGRVTAVNLVHGSGVAALDREALAWVRRASPFPAPPSGGTMDFTVPLIFNPR
jgi:protein TonB